MGMESKGHKNKRKKFFVTKIIKGQKRRVEAGSDALPVYIVLPILLAPSVLLTNTIENVPQVMGGHAVYNITSNMPQLLEMHGPFSIDLPYNLESFSRMLAKIAHSFAVAELGEENFEPALLRIIDGTNMSNVGALIGQHETLPNNWDYRRYTHHISLRIVSTPHGDYAGQWVCVGVHLFCRYTPMRYTIVAGRLTPTATLLKWEGMGRLAPSQLEDFRRHYRLLP
jgi:hypothetical protein